MVRDSVTQLLLFIAVVSIATLFVGTMIVEVGLYSQSVGEEGDRAAAAIDAEIEIINDPEAGATYDEDTKTVTLYVKNVGGSTLEPANLDVLVDGEYVALSSSEVLSGEEWRVGRVLEVQLERSLATGSHRTVARLHGTEALFGFEVGTWSEQLVWSTNADWSAGSHKRTVSDDIGDREADTVRLGYDTEAVGLRSYWTFDEESGSTAFDAAGSNDGDHVNDPTLGRTGLVGSTAYGFDGVDDRVLVPDAESLRFDGDMAVSLWVNTTDLGTSAVDNNQTVLVDKSDWENRTGYAVADNGDYSDEVYFRVHGNGSHWDATVDRALVNDGEWHNIVGVREGDEIRLYLDGELRDQMTNTTLETNDVDLGLAGDRFGHGPFDGELDEVQLYDWALDGAAVDALYRTAADGTHTTGWKTTSQDLNVSDLQLENVSAVLDGDATVYVETDTTGDSTPDEVSAPIELGSNETYPVEGLDQNTDRFRIRVDFATTDVTRTAIVSQLELSGTVA